MLSTSVVIPCYNAEAYLAEALESVQRQTRAPLEVLVIDDASTDGSAAVAARFAHARFPVRVIRNPKNLGGGGSRNTAIAAARGDVIAMLDADDYWSDDHLASVVGLLDEYPDVAVAASHAQSFGDGAGGRWECRVPPGPPQEVFWTAFEGWIVPHNAVAVRTAAARAVGGYYTSAKFAEDYDFFMRLAWRHPFAATGRATAWWRRHRLQESSADYPGQRVAVRRRRAAFMAAVRSEATPDEMARMERVATECWWRDVRTDMDDPDALARHLRERAGVQQVPRAALLRLYARVAAVRAYRSPALRPLRAVRRASRALVAVRA